MIVVKKKPIWLPEMQKSVNSYQETIPINLLTDYGKLTVGYFPPKQVEPLQTHFLQLCIHILYQTKVVGRGFHIGEERKHICACWVTQQFIMQTCALLSFLVDLYPACQGNNSNISFIVLLFRNITVINLGYCQQNLV